MIVPLLAQLIIVYIKLKQNKEKQNNYKENKKKEKKKTP
jgi:predicted histidine transporter YuiF (NhaC family)|tara:strand:+ start:75 stop:191 length:117 start_codon:yes stop_codon:yes gene_type:complete